MELPLEEISNAADDARIELTEEELRDLKTEIQKAWSQLDTIENKELESVRGTYYAFKGQNTLRNDLLKPSLTQREVLKNAPDADETYFHIPRIIEQ